MVWNGFAANFLVYFGCYSLPDLFSPFLSLFALICGRSGVVTHNNMHKYGRKCAIGGTVFGVFSCVWEHCSHKS